MSTAATGRSRAIVFSETGEPSKVLKLHSYDLKDLPSDHVHVRFRGASINPADLNQVEGTYAAKATFRENLDSSTPLAVGGNEGVAEVVSVGKDVKADLQKGDWTLMSLPGFGTWRTEAYAPASQLLKVPKEGLSIAQAATLSINPGTAYRMLKDFVDLKPGDFVVQNGANSGVGQWVIQLAREWNLQTINIVRDRPEIDQLKTDLKALGATHVITPDEIKSIKDITGGKAVRLGLNCVGGRMTTDMAKYLRPGGHLVTYGAMARQPLTLPAALFIFGDLHCHGFWVSSWYKNHPQSERQAMLEDIIRLLKAGKVKESVNELTTWNLFTDNDETLFEKFQSALNKAGTSFGGKKQILVFD